jgi:hypothetical protein
VEYRETFLKGMLEHADYFFQYEGDDMNIETAPVLKSSHRPRVLVTHDESCFSSYDGTATIWMDANDQPLRPKQRCRNTYYLFILFKVFRNKLFPVSLQRNKLFRCHSNEE